jgi:NDP-sugar pyrophosphorylase family protein
MSAPALLILAAGKGSRYGGFKLNDPVGPGGETLMEYSIFDARHAGFGRIIFVIRHEIERAFQEMVTARFGKHLAAEYVYQELPKIPAGFRVPPGRIKPWGTTQAILMAAQTIHEPFGVINVDDFYGTDSFHTLARHLQSGSSDYATVGFVLRNTLPEFGSVARGLCKVDNNGFLTSIVEMKNVEREGGHALSTDSDGRETRLIGDELVSMNMWGFSPAAFAQLEDQFRKFLEAQGSDLAAECYIPNTVNELLQSGQARVRVFRSPHSWFGVTYRDDHARAVESIRHLIEAGNYPRRLAF